jgi:branched-chain amino acid aminotransferase
MYFNDKTYIYFDGDFVKADEAKVNLYLQTLHYGYGVFEGIRSYATDSGPKIFKAKEHYRRLQQSCSLMNIPFHYSIKELEEISYKVLEKNNISDAYIRPLVMCSPNMSLTKAHHSMLLIAAWEWSSYLGQKLLDIKTSSFCRPHPRSIKVEAKACGHYVNSILAVNEAKEAGYDEALLLDNEGWLAEGPGANLFFEKGGQLYTPQKGNLLPGITRDTVFEICKQLDIVFEEGKYLPADLYNADAAFYCGTGAEIVGINSVDGKQLAKEWNETVSAQVQKAYQQLVREKDLQAWLKTA